MTFADAFAFQHSVLKEQGKYPHCVRIWAPPASSPVDEYGRPSGEPTLWADDVPASVVPTSGTERSDRAMTEAEITHVVYLEFVEGLTSAHRIEFENRTLEIFAAIDVGSRNIEWELHCTEER